MSFNCAIGARKVSVYVEKGCRLGEADGAVEQKVHGRRRCSGAEGAEGAEGQGAEGAVGQKVHGAEGAVG